MRILLTGPTGFIGRSVLQACLNRQDEVAALVQPGTALAEPWRGRHSPLEVPGTLADAPWDTLRAFRPEVCIHTAWITTPGVYWESPENDRFLAWSMVFAQRFFESGGRYFLGLGSCAEYQASRALLEEDAAALSSATRYARTKHAFHQTLADLAPGHGAASGWARVFYPYGVGELPDRFCSTVIREFAAGRTVTLRTPGSIKDYLYIDDVGTAIRVVAERRLDGAINIGSGQGVAVRDLARIIAFAMNCPQLLEESDPPDHDPLDHVVADSTRLRSLGWKPMVSLQDGVGRLMRHLLDPSANT